MFIEGLASGFGELGIRCETVSSPIAMLKRTHDLRNPEIFKIFSTWGGFFAPVAKNYCVVAHGFPRVDAQGWPKVILILLSYLHAAKNGRLVAVSDYSASHLKACFGIKAAATIRNPLHDTFFESMAPRVRSIDFLFVGRLHPVKRLSGMLKAALALADDRPGLKIQVVGHGPEEQSLRREFESRGVHFLGSLTPADVRDQLDSAKVFFSGCETEALGLVYLEALARGCRIVMPACGGGLEIAPSLLGKTIFLSPINQDLVSTKTALESALDSAGLSPDVDAFRPSRIAQAYLDFSKKANS